MHTNLAEQFSLAAVITGLASDLKDRRSGKISIEDARVRGELAKQMIAAVRLYVQAQKYLEQNLRQTQQKISGGKGT